MPGRGRLLGLSKTLPSVAVLSMLPLLSSESQLSLSGTSLSSITPLPEFRDTLVVPKPAKFGVSCKVSCLGEHRTEHRLRFLRV